MLFALSLVLISVLCKSIFAFPTTLVRRDIDQTTFNNLAYIEQFAAASYCTSDDAVANNQTEVDCSAGNCPLVAAATVPILYAFLNVGDTDTSGFVAVDQTTNRIVASFRGSRTDENAIADIDFIFVDNPVCSGCLVHTGFLQSWTAVKTSVMGVIQTAKSSYPGYQVIATGHSLGAAIATLAAADMRDAGIDVALYTYGSPMVGNLAFAKYVTNQQSQNFRVTHEADVVPKLPGELLGYYHLAPEYFISSGNDVSVTTSDITAYNGIQMFPNYHGNLATWDDSISDHSWYFNAISACQ